MLDVAMSVKVDVVREGQVKEKHKCKQEKHKVRIAMR
jgi:hypothetical protein